MNNWLVAGLILLAWGVISGVLIFLFGKLRRRKWRVLTKRYIKRNRHVIGAVLIATLIVPIVAYVSKFSGNGFSDEPEQWGQMGDFFGGLLNPILAFASFMALLYTIRIQSEELRLTREELAKSSDAQQKSAGSQIMQLLLQKQLKQFSSIESLFLKYHFEADRIYHQNKKENNSIEEIFSIVLTEKLARTDKVNALDLKNSLGIRSFAASDFRVATQMMLSQVLNAKFQFDKLIQLAGEMEENFDLLLESYADSLSFYLMIAGICAQNHPLFMPDEVNKKYLSRPLAERYRNYSIELPSTNILG